MPRLDDAPANGRTAAVRGWCGLTAAVTLALGLALQLVGRTVLVDLAGGALYTLLLALTIAILAPRWSPWLPAALALGLSVLIELSQLTGVPASLVAALPPLRLVFGSSFDPLDLLAYAFGGLLAWAVRSAIGRLAQARWTSRKRSQTTGMSGS